jgi:anti-sigma B factor antagonist
MLEINVSELKRCVILEVIGRVDSSNAVDFKEAMDKALERRFNNLILNLKGVEYMSSQGLVQMVAILKLLERRGGRIIIAEPSDRVKEVMELAGLDTIFEIYPTETGAVGSI